MKIQEKKRLSLVLPASLMKFYAKLCIDMGISQTEGLVQIFTHLKKHGGESGFHFKKPEKTYADYKSQLSWSLHSIFGD